MTFDQKDNNLAQIISQKTSGFSYLNITKLFSEIEKLILINKLPLNLETINQAIPKINKSVQEHFIDLEPFYFKNICGYQSTKTLLETTIQLPLKNPEIFIKRGLKLPKGILLYGPPGCSKTMFARALAHESQMNFISIKGPEIFNKYVGDSEKKIWEIFQSAQ